MEYEREWGDSDFGILKGMWIGGGGELSILGDGPNCLISFGIDPNNNNNDCLMFLIIFI